MKKEKIKRNFFTHWALILIFFVQLFAGSWHIGEPFYEGQRHYNWGAAFWLQKARVTNEVGIFNAKLGIASGKKIGEDGKETISYYQAHPQLIGPTFALWTKGFGYKEWSVRFFTLLWTLGATIFLYCALFKLKGKSVAAMGTALFAFFPIIYIYGRSLNQEALVMFFLMVTFFGITKRFLDESHAFAYVSIGMLGMVLSDWSGFVFAAWITLSSLLFLKRSSDKQKMVLIGCGMVLLGLFLFAVQRYLQTPPEMGESVIGKYVSLWEYRAGLDIQEQINIWPIFFRNQLAYFRDNFTYTLTLLAFIGLLYALQELLRQKFSPEKRLLIIFAIAVLLGQITYLCVVPQAAVIHTYYQYFYAIPFCIGILFFLDLVVRLFKIKSKKIIIGLFVIIFSFNFLNALHFYRYRVIADPDPSRKEAIYFTKKIGDVPIEKNVIAIGYYDNWFNEGNVIYYAKRVVKTYGPEQFPFADYMVVPKKIVTSQESLSIIRTMVQQDITITVQTCSSLMCLLEIKAL